MNINSHLDDLEETLPALGFLDGLRFRLIVLLLMMVGWLLQGKVYVEIEGEQNVE